MGNSSATTNMSGWNFVLTAALRKAKGAANLSSVLAVSQKLIDDWITRQSVPSPRKLEAMRRYLETGTWARKEADRLALRMLRLHP
jgi:hypothetical protein